MNPHRTRWLAPLLALVACAGCFAFDAYDKKLVGPYRLNATDTLEDMAIMWEIPDGGLVGDGLPGPTVFAAGYDDKYLVAGVHPSKCKPGEAGCIDWRMNPLITQYWYVIRSPDEARNLPYKGIKGPFTAAQFAAEKARLKLPVFSIRFRDLE